MNAGELRPGNAINLDGKLYVVAKYETTKPGKGPAYAQVKLRDVTGGKYIERRFSTSEKLEGINLDRRTMEYLYSDSDGAVFMDDETFEQYTIAESVLGDALMYLRPNTGCTVLMHGENPLTLEVPLAVILKVTETPPGIKGATATNQLKPATCETGLQTKVPPFIEPGEEIKLNTEDGSYISRAKD